ncbi:MAG: holo-[acyl-carrier-protein] synthase [Lachnospiraceae bacterium]|nr:holo-[acyl-carrier-protein] synthase [Lachnospiraceae bacterium]
MIYGIGNDIIEISRVERACEREHFLEGCFTEDEIKSLGKHMQSLAGNFAAKEAVAKAFGTGFRGFDVKSVEVLRDELGKPYVNLYDGAKEMFEKLELKHIHITISHCKEYAMAVCIIEK